LLTREVMKTCTEIAKFAAKKERKFRLRNAEHL